MMWTGSEHGIQQNSPAGRQEFERQMEARRLEDADEEEIKALRRGWCLGSEPFRQKMLELVEGQARGKPLRGTAPGNRRAKGQPHYLRGTFTVGLAVNRCAVGQKPLLDIRHGRSKFPP